MASCCSGVSLAWTIHSPLHSSILSSFLSNTQLILVSSIYDTQVTAVELASGLHGKRSSLVERFIWSGAEANLEGDRTCVFVLIISQEQWTILVGIHHRIRKEMSQRLPCLILLAVQC